MSPAPLAPAAPVCFQETGKCVSEAFYQYWLDNGGLVQQGLPISDEFAEVSPTDGKTYRTQYFERARFEHHPENRAPFNVLLGLLGREQFLARYPQGGPTGAPTGAPDEVCFEQTGRCASGAFIAYWQRNGGLAQQGLPISDAFDEVSPSDGKAYRVQYFERARFEHHPENDAPYDLLLGLLGREQFGARYPSGDPTSPPANGGLAFNRNIRVGPGFSDVSPRQLVRTRGNVLYAVVPTCDGYPSCPNSELLVYRGNQTGTPGGFAAQDTANRPLGVGSSATAIDGSDVLHVLWNDRAGRVLYARFDTATDRWGPRTVLADTNWTDFGQGEEGVALALDAAGAPHAVWTVRAANRELHIYYANAVGGEWSGPTRVDDAPLAGNFKSWHPTLAFAPDGTLLLAWYVGTFNGANDATLHVRERTPAGEWQPSGPVGTVGEARSSIDQGPSLLVTAEGVRHIAFIRQPDDAIRYYANAGAGWTPDHPAGGSQVTHNPSLGPDGRGGVRLYGHGTPMPAPDGHGDNLYYFEKPAGGRWSDWTLYATGAYDSSVSARWSQFFHHYPERLDILYWADPYPNVLYAGCE